MNQLEMSRGQRVREKIVAAVVEYIQIHGYAPTTREIGAMVGLKSTSSVHTHMQKLIDTSKLESDTEWRNPRAIRVPGYMFVRTEEILKFRKLGTAEELEELKESGAFTGLELAQIAAMQMKLKGYQAIGTEDACRTAMERMKPKKPTYEGDGYAPDGTFVWDEWLCPNCNSRYEVDYDNHDYCPNCGQAIDWSQEENGCE